MNLNDVYNMFYKKGFLTDQPLWPGKKEQKKKFFIDRDLIPYALRDINMTIWNDKSRRSRFLADSKSEPKYITDLIIFMRRHPFIISRMEHKCKILLQEEIDVIRYKEIIDKFLVTNKDFFSSDLLIYISGKDKENLVRESWKSMAFLIIYALVDVHVNELYRNFLLNVKLDAKKMENDQSVFISEFPADGKMFFEGDIIEHTWVIQNRGTVVWNNRCCECLNPEIVSCNSNLCLSMPEKVYPGEIISLKVSFQAPERLGNYELMWKMKNERDEFCFPEDIGLGLHFSITEKIREEGSDILLIAEEPKQVPQYQRGTYIKHKWVIKNTSKSVWENCSFECINYKTLKYAKNELSVFFCVISNQERKLISILDLQCLQRQGYICFYGN